MNALPTEERVCPNCGQSKLENQFSLVKGVHSDLRKVICVKCELKIRQARTHGISIDRLEAALNCSCMICGKPSEKIVTNKIKGVILGIFCSRCFTFIKSFTSPENGQETAISVQNYFMMQQWFPFLLTISIDDRVTNSDLPLLDFIESNDRNK